MPLPSAQACLPALNAVGSHALLRTLPPIIVPRRKCRIILTGDPAIDGYMCRVVRRVVGHSHWKVSLLSGPLAGECMELKSRYLRPVVGPAVCGAAEAAALFAEARKDDNADEPIVPASARPKNGYLASVDASSPQPSNAAAATREDYRNTSKSERSIVETLVDDGLDANCEPGAFYSTADNEAQVCGAPDPKDAKHQDSSCASVRDALAESTSAMAAANPDDMEAAALAKWDADFMVDKATAMDSLTPAVSDSANASHQQRSANGRHNASVKHDTRPPRPMTRESIFGDAGQVGVDGAHQQAAERPRRKSKHRPSPGVIRAWRCDFCTLVNERILTHCEACHARNPDFSIAARSRPREFHSDDDVQHDDADDADDDADDDLDDKASFVKLPPDRGPNRPGSWTQAVPEKDSEQRDSPSRVTHEMQEMQEMTTVAQVLDETSDSDPAGMTTPESRPRKSISPSSVEPKALFPRVYPQPRLPRANRHSEQNHPFEQLPRSQTPSSDGEAEGDFSPDGPEPDFSAPFTCTVCTYINCEPGLKYLCAICGAANPLKSLRAARHRRRRQRVFPGQPNALHGSLSDGDAAESDPSGYVMRKKQELIGHLVRDVNCATAATSDNTVASSTLNQPPGSSHASRRLQCTEDNSSKEICEPTPARLSWYLAAHGTGIWEDSTRGKVRILKMDQPSGVQGHRATCRVGTLTLGFIGRAPGSEWRTFHLRSTSVVKIYDGASLVCYDVGIQHAGHERVGHVAFRVKHASIAQSVEKLVSEHWRCGCLDRHRGHKDANIEHTRAAQEVVDV